MNRQEILQSLDEEIVRLQQVKDLLQGNRGLGPSLEKLVSNGTANGSGHRPRRRNMSEEGRRHR